MMAALFLLYFVAITLIFFSKKKYAIALTFFTLVLCVLMLYYHATDTLQIRL